MPDYLYHYFASYISMACAIFLLLLQQLRSFYKFRHIRGEFLLCIPSSIRRIWMLILRATIISVALVYTISKMVTTLTPLGNKVHTLFLLASFLLSIGLLWTIFTFIPIRLYENGMLDHLGYTPWSHLSYAEEKKELFRLRITERDFSRSGRLGKGVSLFCAAGQQDRVRDILKDRLKI